MSASNLARRIAPLLLLCGCDSYGDAPALSRRSAQLQPGRQVPNVSEQAAIGEVRARISRVSPGFRQLTRSQSPDIVFKDEEETGADRVMTRRLEARLQRLARLVDAEWSGVQLRVTEAWDEEGEHGRESAHYEARAADLTTSDLDPAKLGRLAYLAVQAGFDWVYFENRAHVHVSVRR